MAATEHANSIVSIEFDCIAAHFGDADSDYEDSPKAAIMDQVIVDVGTRALSNEYAVIRGNVPPPVEIGSAGIAY